VRVLSLTVAGEELNEFANLLLFCVTLRGEEEQEVPRGDLTDRILPKEVKWQMAPSTASKFKSIIYSQC
jgi:hypothetical protein